MEGRNFDEIARTFAKRGNRRGFIRGVVGVIAGALGLGAIESAEAASSCRFGFKLCGSRCIPTSSCCSAADCARPANGSATCSGGACGFTCRNGYKKCGRSCIPNGQCCTSGDCGSTSNGSFSCSAGVCSVTCASGYRACSGKCIPAGHCCVAGDCPGQRNASAICLTGACTYVCAAGHKVCGTDCIATDQCCSAVECSAPAEATATCDAGVCGFTCRGGWKQCGSGCIASNQCCTSSDCPTPANGNATCTKGKCGIACDAGFSACEDACLGNDECCTARDCPDVQQAVAICAPDDDGKRVCSYRINSSKGTTSEPTTTTTTTTEEPTTTTTTTSTTTQEPTTTTTTAEPTTTTTTTSTTQEPTTTTTEEPTTTTSTTSTTTSTTSTTTSTTTVPPLTCANPFWGSSEAECQGVYGEFATYVSSFGQCSCVPGYVFNDDGNDCVATTESDLGPGICEVTLSFDTDDYFCTLQLCADDCICARATDADGGETRCIATTGFYQAPPGGCSDAWCASNHPGTVCYYEFTQTGTTTVFGKCGTPCTLPTTTTTTTTTQEPTTTTTTTLPPAELDGNWCGGLYATEGLPYSGDRYRFEVTTDLNENVTATDNWDPNWYDTSFSYTLTGENAAGCSVFASTACTGNDCWPLEEQFVILCPESGSWRAYLSGNGVDYDIGSSAFMTACGDCTSNADCPGQACFPFYGVCVDCATSADCPMGENCNWLELTCVVPTLTVWENTAGDWDCFSDSGYGVCVPACVPNQISPDRAPCNTDADCPVNGLCIYGGCTTCKTGGSTCSDGDECASGNCDNGVCACYDLGEAPPTGSNNPGSAAFQCCSLDSANSTVCNCYGQGTSCNNDNNCCSGGCVPDPDTGIGVCKECRIDANCAGNPNGETCDTTTNTCVGCVRSSDCPNAGDYCDENQTCQPGVVPASLVGERCAGLGAAGSSDRMAFIFSPGSDDDIVLTSFWDQRYYTCGYSYILASENNDDCLVFAAQSLDYDPLGDCWPTNEEFFVVCPEADDWRAYWSGDGIGYSLGYSGLLSSCAIGCLPNPCASADDICCADGSDFACTDRTTDPENCGACGAVCERDIPFCRDGVCGGCIENSDCEGSDTPFCVDGLCVECENDDDCSEAPGGPNCNTQGVCASCLIDDDCSATAETPLCSQTLGQCVECVSNEDCPAGDFCDPLSTCSMAVVPSELLGTWSAPLGPIDDPYWSLHLVLGKGKVGDVVGSVLYPDYFTGGPVTFLGIDDNDCVVLTGNLTYDGDGQGWGSDALRICTTRRGLRVEWAYDSNLVSVDVGLLSPAGPNPCNPTLCTTTVCCDGTCLDGGASSDPLNCGACGNVCGAETPLCNTGKCIECLDDTYCTTDPDRTYCSESGRCVGCRSSEDCAESPAGPYCSSRTSTCGTNQCESNGDCDGGESCCNNMCIDTKTDASNCGTCGTTCSDPALPYCANSSCVACTDDTHCAAEENCRLDTNVCAPYQDHWTNCNADWQCEGDYCAGVCVPAALRDQDGKCDTDADCATGGTCIYSGCLFTGMAGDACSVDNDCLSGNCADGFCACEPLLSTPVVGDQNRGANAFRCCSLKVDTGSGTCLCQGPFSQCQTDVNCCTGLCVITGPTLDKPDGLGTGTCVECTTDAHCAGNGNGEICDLVTNRCGTGTTPGMIDEPTTTTTPEPTPSAPTTTTTTPAPTTTAEPTTSTSTTATPLVCSGPSDCPGVSTICAVVTCDAGLCGVFYPGTDTACEGGFCDAAGQCVPTTTPDSGAPDPIACPNGLGDCPPAELGHTVECVAGACVYTAPGKSGKKKKNR